MWREARNGGALEGATALGDFPPSGKAAEMTLMQFVRIENGLIVEEWEQFNSRSQQIGGDPSGSRRLALRLIGRGLHSPRGSQRLD